MNAAHESVSGIRDQVDAAHIVMSGFDITECRSKSRERSFDQEKPAPTGESGLNDIKDRSQGRERSSEVVHLTLRHQRRRPARVARASASFTRASQ